MQCVILSIMNCVLVGQVNEWEKNDSSNHAACYEAPKGDMVMEKIDIGWKNYIAIFLFAQKKIVKKLKTICIILQKFCICLKNRKLYKVEEKKCVSMLCVHLQKFAFAHMMRNWLWK